MRSIKFPVYLLLFLVMSLTIAAPAYADLTASVTLVGSGSIYPGETTSLSITLANSNIHAAGITGTGFSNTLPGALPNGLKVSGAYTYNCANASGAVATTGSVTADIGSQTITLAGGTIPAHIGSTDGTCTIIIPVTAGSSTGNSANYTYTIAANAVEGSDSTGVVRNSGAVSQSINVNAMARPTISKGFSNNTVTLGGDVRTLTITLANTNPVAIPNFTISDTFPVLGGTGIIKVAALPAATSTCTGAGIPATFAPVAGDTSISATGGTVAANSSCTITVAIEGNHTNGAYTTGAQANTIDASGQFINDLGLPASANATANITVRSPLAVSKAFAHAYLAGGQSDTFTITLTNNGNTDLVVNTFDDNPIDGVAGITYGLVANAAGTSTNCAGGLVELPNFGDGVGDGIRLTGGTIPHNGSCTITVNFTGTPQTAGVPRSFTNTIAENAVKLIGGANSYSQSATSSIIVSDDLRVTKTITPSLPSQVAPGNPVRYAVTVENWSASDINSVVITDTLANGLTFLTGTINGINYTPTLSGTAGCAGLTVTGATGASAPQFTLGTLPHRQGDTTAGSCTVTFYAMTATGAANGSSTSNQIPAGGVCYNGGATCNGGASTSAGGTVTTSTLSVAKAYNLSSPRPEGTVTRMTLTFTNLSANPLTGVAVADTLPTAASGGQMRVATPSNAASTCGSPTITAVANSTSIAMSGGTVPARAANGTGVAGTCVLQVDVVAAAGIYTSAAGHPNTATVQGTETYANNTTHTIGPVSASADFTFSSALSATKSFIPAAVSSGGRSKVTVRLNNAGAVALTNVALTDPLPGGMVLANPTNAYTTCAGSTSVTAVTGTSNVTLSGASIAGGGNCDFIFDVIATGSANWVNTIPSGNITADGAVSNQMAVTGTLNYNAPDNPTVTKATNPSTLTFPGQVSQLTITITNGTQAVTNLRITDYFTVNGISGGALNGMVISATPAAATTCPGGIVSAAAGGTSVGVSGVSLAASASCTVSVNVTSTAIGGITNYIPASSIITDQGLTNSGQATTSLATQSNIGVVKQFTPSVVKPLIQRSRLRITFYNPTSLPMANLAVTDTLPAGVTVPSGPDFATTCTGAIVSSPAANQLQVSVGTIAAASGGVSASCYAETDVIVAAQGDYVNTIAASAVTATSGGAPVTNSQPTSDTLRAKSPLVIHKAIGGYTLDAGSPVGFTTGSANRAPGSFASLVIRIDNPNPIPLTAAAFTDTLPANLVVATTPNASTTCALGTVTASASATSIRLSGATIPASSFCTLTVDVISNISGSYTNTIAASGITTFEGVTNEEPTSAQIVVSTPPTVSKQFAPAVIQPNGTSTLTIFLGNDNSSAITLSSIFTDTLPTAPGNITVVNPPVVSKTCPGAVTAIDGSGTISYATGALIPAGGCSISATVTGSVSGVHTNTIRAGDLQTSAGNNQLPANSTLTVSTMGFISGRVFKDNNLTPNGTYEAGTDTSISSASIELRSGATCSGAIVVISGLANPAITDVNGNYMFSNLPAGTYSVCEPVQPTGTVNGTTTAGTITPVNGSTGTAGTASNPTSVTSQIIGIVLNGDGTASSISGSTGNNFAEIVPSTISGTIFLDQNNNGIQNGADSGIAGVTVELLNNAGTVVATTTTDANGAYSFANQLPGTYSVREPSQPTSTANGITTAGTVANGGTAGTAAIVTTVPSVISTIILPPNTITSGNNFAEIPLGRRISGVVFLDYNAVFGVFDGADHGIGSQTLNLTGADINGNTVSATTNTAADGTYSFTGLPEGTYIVTQPLQPTGTTNGITTAGSTGGAASLVGATPSVISAISLVGANSVSANNNFAELPGAAPDLALAKTHTPSSLGELSSTGYFTLTPSNVGTIATSGTISLTDPFPAGLTPTSATGNGWTCGISVRTVTCTTSSVIAATSTGNPIIVHVTVGAGLAGQILINTGTVSGGGEPAGFNGNNSATDAVPIATTASLQGMVWLDADHDKIPGAIASEPRLGNWIAELYLNDVLVASTVSAADGTYSFANISPGSGYQVKFRATANGAIFGKPVTNEDGITFAGVDAVKNPTGANTADGTLKSMTLVSGTNYTKQSLPVDPSGVVYDSITRLPVSGATVRITGTGAFDPDTHLVGGAANATQVTGTNGYYQFLLLAGAPLATYTLTVTTPPGYKPGVSAIIPPTAGSYTPVGAPPPPNADIQPQPQAPTGAQVTTYYLSFILSGVSKGVVNNHIPIDPILGGAIITTKTTPLVNVKRGDLVPYTITMTNTLSAMIPNIDAQDLMPPGFKYRTGSGTLNGVRTEPVVAGRELKWRNLTFTAAEKKTFLLILVVGSGVSEGEYTNQAYAINNVVNTAVSNIATATVRVVPDPTFDCSEIIGKVFDDKNANGYQDDGEPGIANVRLATARGLIVTTDAEGRFHIPCPQIPNENRGSNFIMKLDDRTLPSGYRITTENPRAVRLTRGKMTKMNFGATVHRVIRIEVNDAAFEKDDVNLRDEWQKKIAKLETQLRERSTVVRIAYRMGAESKKLAGRRIKSIHDMLQALWKKGKDCPPLVFEEEIVEVR